MPIFLNAEEIHKLLDLARRSSPRDHAILALMSSTGLRESDALSIRRRDILTDNGTVASSLRLRMQKTGKIVERKLTTSTQETIAVYLRTAPKSQYLFPGELIDMPLSRRTLHRIFKRHLRSLVGPNVSLRSSSTHTCRRSVAAIIAENRDIQSAAYFLAHTSISNTIRYLSKKKLATNVDTLMQEIDL
jgi:integrase